MVKNNKKILSKHWMETDESGSSIGIWILFFIYRWLGHLPFLLALYPVMVYFFLVKTQARHASLDYLRHIQAFNPKIRASIWMSFKHFMSFGDILLDKLLIQTGRYKRKDAIFLGREMVQECMDQKRGFILFTAHMGNSEISRFFAQFQQIPLNILVHNQQTKRFNHISKNMNSSGSINLIQVSDLDSGTIMSLTEKVSAGEAVVITADRIPAGDDAMDKRTVQAKFLGEKALFPTGPYVLAHLLQVPVFFVSCTKYRKTYHLEYQLFSQYIDLPRKNRKEILASYAQQLANILEQQCLKTPLQWFNFYSFWQLPLSPDFTNRS